MRFMRRGGGECLMADKEESKGINLGSTGWTCWHEGTRRSSSPSGVCRNGEDMRRCMYMEVLASMIACIFALCCFVFREGGMVQGED